MNHSQLRIVLLSLLVGCGDTLVDVRDVPAGEPATADETPQGFFDATDATDVPTALLFAISRAETGLQMVRGTAEFEGQEPAEGLMGLRGRNLLHAAELAGLDPELVRTDRSANLLAAAHLLAEWASEEGIDPSDINAWAPIVARYSGISDPDAAAEYVHHEVYEHLREGIEIEGYAVEPMVVAPAYPLPQRDIDRGRDASSIWTPSPNWNSRSGANVDFLIIHTCEGSYSSCWSWLANAASGVSAHYVVNDTGSEIRSLVDENNRAWHIGANYDCANNDGVDCWRNGTSMNSISVGIEHAGFASQSSWNSGQIQRSAELACGITQRNSIPRDSYHIVGHGQLQPATRTDPGANWPWSDYLNRIQQECGDVAQPPSGGGGGGVGGSQFVIDSNNGANNDADFYIETSSNWTSSANVSGYWNTGYWVAPTAAVSDAASFWFRADGTQCFTVEAWWTAASDRPAAATFLGWDSSDNEVGRSVVSQKVNGGRWNRLGDWEFSDGWNRVMLSRWTTAGSYAVADAVRLTPSSNCP